MTNTKESLSPRAQPDRRPSTLSPIIDRASPHPSIARPRAHPHPRSRTRSLTTEDARESIDDDPVTQSTDHRTHARERRERALPRVRSRAHPSSGPRPIAAVCRGREGEARRGRNEKDGRARSSLPRASEVRLDTKQGHFGTFEASGLEGRDQTCFVHPASSQSVLFSEV